MTKRKLYTMLNVWIAMTLLFALFIWIDIKLDSWLLVITNVIMLFLSAFKASRYYHIIQLFEQVDEER